MNRSLNVFAAAVLLGGGWWIPLSCRANEVSCTGILPASNDGGGGARSVEPEDLVRLRDFGSTPDFGNRPIFTISPDGTQIAVQLRRADPVANDYCLALVVVDLREKNAPRVIDLGGKLIRWSSDNLGRADVPTGIPFPIAPIWLPDGRSLLFLKQAGGVAQVWRAFLDGRGSIELTKSPSDIVALKLASDGKTLFYANKESLDQAKSDLTREALRGFHYDDRFSPTTGPRPLPEPPTRLSIFRLDLVTGFTSFATGADAERFRASALDILPGEPALSQRGTKAERVKPDGGDSGAAFIEINDTDGRRVQCRAAACKDALPKIWWSQDGNHIRFMRYEGWGQSLTGFYEWLPGKAAPRRIMVSPDRFLGCQAYGDDLLCAQEASNRPRFISRINFRQGTSRTIFDPNPEFSKLKLGTVERLQWKNAYGMEAYGDLVLPPGYRAGVQLPLIITQYRTRGFLRGATGDEVPIQAFVGRGYAVLSTERPRPVPGPAADLTAKARENSDLEIFTDRKNVLSSIEAAIDILDKRQLIDKSRIGITGLSDGSSTVQYAAAQGRPFAAASVSGCCWERSQDALLGPGISEDFRAAGWPALNRKAETFWSNISLVDNAAKVPFPILFQTSDDEYLMALESYTALRAVGIPTDLYVFEDEHHNKWQPAHRLAVYERNLDWFDFWLKGVLPSNGIRRQEASRWGAMRDARRKTTSQPARHGWWCFPGNSRHSPYSRHHRGNEP